MARPTADPNVEDWTRWSRECAGSLVSVPLRDVADFLGQRDVAGLVSWAAAIDALGADLAEQVGCAWPHTATTPIAVLLRQLGRFASELPQARTLLGAALMTMIEAAERQRRARLAAG